MKKIVLFFMLIFTTGLMAQVDRPNVIVQDVINNLYATNVFTKNVTLRPAAIPRMADSVYAPYSAPFAMIDTMIGPVDDKIGQTLQMYGNNFDVFYFYSDGVNWITSQLSYLVNTPYQIELRDSIFHDFHGNDTFDLMWPGDSVPDGSTTCEITIYINNYEEGVGIPITIYDADGTDYTTETFINRDWLDVDGETVFWYDWERTITNDTTTWTVIVDKTKINWGEETFVVARLEFYYPKGYSEGGPPSQPYPGTSFAIKVMKDTPE